MKGRPGLQAARPARARGLPCGAMRRRSRRVLIAGGSLFALLALGLATGEALGWPWLQQPAQRALQRAAGAPVRLDGSFHLRLLPQPRLRAQQVTVGAAHALPVPHLLAAEGVLVEAAWGDLWRWRRGAPLALRTLAADTLDANLLRQIDGRASWQLGRRDAHGAQPPREPPRIATWVVRRGVLRWRDALREADLELRLNALAEPAGGYEGTLHGRYRELPLQLALRSGGLLPLVDARAAAPVALRVEGTAGAGKLLFDGRAGALLDARRLDGRIDVAGPSLARVGAPLGLTLPQTPPFRLQGRLAHGGGDAWTLNGAQVHLGGTAFAGDFRYDRATAPPTLSGRAAGPRLALADLGVAVGVRGQEPGARVLPQRRFDLPALRVMQADVTLAFEQLLLGAERLGPIADARAHLLLKDGVLRIEDLQAVVAQGRLRGRSQLDANSATGRWQAQLAMDDVDIARWIHLPATRGRAPAGAASAPAQQPLTGRFDASFDVRGEGVSTAAILGSLDGQAKARLSHGTLSHLITEGVGLDLAQALGVALRGDQPLALRCAMLDLAFENGRATIRRGIVDNSDSTIAVGGRVDLRNEKLELALRARPKDFSPLSLRSPITVTGSFEKPQLGIDASRLSRRVLGSVALAAVVAPVAALIPLIDLGDEPKVDPCASPPAK